MTQLTRDRVGTTNVTSNVTSMMTDTTCMMPEWASVSPAA
jgi:hypothetical protein